LNDDYLHKHLKMYVRNGMDEQAGRADIEIRRRGTQEVMKLEPMPI